MARSKYIESVLKAAGNKTQSVAWFRNKIKEFGEPKSADLLRDGKRTSVPTFGILNIIIISINITMVRSATVLPCYPLNRHAKTVHLTNNTIHYGKYVYIVF